MKASKSDEHSGAVSVTDVGDAANTDDEGRKITHFAFPNDVPDMPGLFGPDAFSARGIDGQAWAIALLQNVARTGTNPLDQAELAAWFTDAIEYARTTVVSGEVTSAEVASKAGRLLPIIDALEMLSADVRADLKSICASVLTQRPGMTTVDDKPCIDEVEANAIEFETDETGKVWLNVDGVCRVRFGHATIIKTVIGGNHVVRFDKRKPEPVTPTPIEELDAGIVDAGRVSVADD